MAGKSITVAGGGGGERAGGIPEEDEGEEVLEEGDVTMDAATVGGRVRVTGKKGLKARSALLCHNRYCLCSQYSV